jgi:hypothetical protein
MTQDIGYGARLLVRDPGFSTTALLSLTLGIGATTAIFNLVDAVSLPYRNPIYRSLYGSASRISFFRHLSEKLTLRTCRTTSE